jgi:hypothetical protein
MSPKTLKKLQEILLEIKNNRLMLNWLGLHFCGPQKMVYDVRFHSFACNLLVYPLFCLKFTSFFFNGLPI